MKVLVTGGAGFIGSTICSALLDNGHTPIILDSLVTGKRAFTRGRIFYEGDIADSALVGRILKEHPDIQVCIDCAALIVVPDSVANPYLYYRENVAKSLELFHTLAQGGVKKIVFSSSASIYDQVEGYVVNENSPLKPSSPYARTKFMMEMILQDVCKAYGMKGMALRYFNPIGADPKMRTGMPIQMPSHVLGKILSVENGLEDIFHITGTDWPTRDGTGLRDYIHVWDLAMAHVLAAQNFDEAFRRAGEQHYLVINLGTGRGVTVRELLAAVEKVVGHKIPTDCAPARPGDVAGACANCDRALELLGWKAERPIEEGISSALAWTHIRDQVIAQGEKG
nr:UDP-glucose 4-epimerase GalE [bacterium]